MKPADELRQLQEREAAVIAEGRPADPDLALRRGELLEKLAEYNEAIAALEEAARLRTEQGLKADPAIPKAMASVLFRLNRYQDSLGEVVNSARLRNQQGMPEDWELSKTRGNCLVRMGKLDEALAAYDRAEQIQLGQGQPVYPYLSLNRGAVYQEMGLLEEALAEFDRTEKLLQEQGTEPHPSLVLNRGVVLKLLRRYEESLDCYTRAREMLEQAGLPDDVNLNMNLGELYSELGRTDEADIHLDRAEQLCVDRGMQPSDLLIFNKALNHQRAGRQEQAVATALRVIEEVSRQGLQVKPFYVETLRDWLTPGGSLSTPVDKTEPKPIPPVPDSEKLHDVFICYRRNPGRPYAMLLKTHLNMLGRAVFRDEDDLHSGHFGENLVHAIRHSRHMVVMLSPDFLERCQDPEDVARQEVATALNCGTHIIPVMMEGFVWPKPTELPEDIRALCRLNAMSFSTEFFSAFIDKLLKWME